MIFLAWRVFFFSWFVVFEGCCGGLCWVSWFSMAWIVILMVLKQTDSFYDEKAIL